jgi:uncharacterized membrane protein
MSSSDEPKKAEEGESPRHVATRSQPETTNVEQPPSESQLRAAAMSMAFSAEMYSGPIPPPSIMAEWEKVIPGSADRILKMAEKQSAHRIAMEQKVVDGDMRRSDRGLIFGFIIALVMIIGGFIIIGLGHDWAGATIITTSLAGVAGLFVYSYISRDKERKSRMNAATTARQLNLPPPPTKPSS